jgi:hypothetical protein
MAAAGLSPTTLGLAGLLLAIAATACSSSYGEASAPRATPAELASRAANDLSHLDDALFSTSSSLDGVAKWDVYMDADIAIVGKDASGAAVAALVVVMDGPAARPVCATKTTSPSCSAMAKAIATDFGPQPPTAPSSVAPKSLHALAEGTSSPDSACTGYIDGLAYELADTKHPLLIALTQLSCIGEEPSPCDFNYQITDADNQLQPPQENSPLTDPVGSDAAKAACCPAGSPASRDVPAPDGLVNSTVRVLCKPAPLLSSEPRREDSALAVASQRTLGEALRCDPT